MRHGVLAAVVLAALMVPLQGAARPDAVIAPPEGELAPVWSPDGAQIAFQSRDGVQVVDVRTRKVAPLLPQAPELAWSPDGRDFLITQSQPAPPPEPRPCSYQHPDWMCIAACPIPLRLPSARAPDTHHDCWKQSDIFITGHGGEPVNLTRTERANEQSPAWSPDGAKIVFSGDNAIWTMNRDGSAPRLVATGFGHQPVWSPDGRTIAFFRNGAILTVDAAGGEAKPLVSGPYYAMSPSWSPDAKMLVYTHDRGQGGVVTVVQSDGSGARHLTKGTDPAWSPRGDWIAFVAPVRERLYAIYIIRPDGGGLTRLTGPSVSSHTSDPACTVAGSPGAETVRGTPERDFACALAGNDIVRTGAGADTVLGGPGRDRLIPGSGPDEIDAGAGNDEVVTIDSPRERDVVRCGKGRDVVYADRRDAVAADCERALRRR
jgi:dipeptidyl aminopeptidase/acylaminoacyl peptidase